MNQRIPSGFMLKVICILIALSPAGSALAGDRGSKGSVDAHQDAPSGMKDAIALCLPVHVIWFLDYNLDGRFDSGTQWGLPGDRWAAGEPFKKHRNGCEEITAYRPHDYQFATWYVKLNDGCPGFSGRFQQRDFYVTSFHPNWQRWPVIGDFNGNGKDEAADYVENGDFGRIVIDRNGNLKWNTDRDVFSNIYYGLDTNDHLMAGDLGAGCCDELAVWRSATGHWEFYGNDVEGRPTTNRWKTTQFGLSGDIPFLANVDGDAMDDLCVFRPTFGWVFINFSSNGYDDNEVDEIIDYELEIERINNEYGMPGRPWTAGALGIHAN
ncbi:MAG: hypothetical protein IT449_14830 [Phycisphaerales bacterium]|nr:hypothetical protein [Phycisphaerales bacterium]